jgi:hypothetical protein
MDFLKKRVGRSIVEIQLYTKFCSIDFFNDTMSGRAFTLKTFNELANIEKLQLVF